MLSTESFRLPAGSDAGTAISSGPDPGPQSQSQSPPSQPPNQSQPAKRARIILSCNTCRASKQKCDRQQPCGQCLKKGRPEDCAFAPKPVKAVPPPRSMTARLKRLESMVRNMMENGTDNNDDGDEGMLSFLRRQAGSSRSQGAQEKREEARAQIVLGTGTTYIGATHFMAMLDDIEDLKSFFDDDDVAPDNLPGDQGVGLPDSEMLLLSSSVPMSKRDVLNMIPARAVADKLVDRFLSANSPTQQLVHRPTFEKQYDEFWLDPWNVPADWLSLLLMVLALGTFFSAFMSPSELEDTASIPAMGRYRQFRAAAGWALVNAKYTSPTTLTLQSYLMYVAAEFMANRSTQTNCYLLCSVGIRLMLKMGLHRDPTKLNNISPFDGEMRRRMWHMAIQIELLVSFHMGLPSMVYGIESDTAMPSNLSDEDIHQFMAVMPPSRPDTEFTQMTYARWKSAIGMVFGAIARQAHALTVPPYGEVMNLDRRLEERWKQTPVFMKVKPLEESVTDPLFQIHQRFGLASLYQKSRCVLHRRYLTEAVPKKEHAYSRRTCLEAAIAMLDYQNIIHLATLPGGMLRQHAWFLAAISTYDFLIAAMIIYVVFHSKTYLEGGLHEDWAESGSNKTPPSKAELYEMLKRSHHIWSTVKQDAPSAKKAVDMLTTMIQKIESDGVREITPAQWADSSGSWVQPSLAVSDWQQQIALGSRNEPADPLANLSINDVQWQPNFGMVGTVVLGDQHGRFPGADLSVQLALGADNPGGYPWLNLGIGADQADWGTFDTAVGGDMNVDLDAAAAAAGWDQQGALPTDEEFMDMFPGPYM